MNYMTQKGQVAIPKGIRDYFGLKPFDKINFEVKDNRIIAQPVLSLKQLRGIAHVPGQKPLSKKAMKKIIRDAVVEKFKRKMRAEQ